MQIAIVADDPLVRSELAATIAGRLNGAGPPAPPLAGVGQPAAIVVAELTPDVTHAATLAGAELVIWNLGDDRAHIASQLALIGDLDIPVLVLGPPEAAAEAMASGARGFLPREQSAARLAAAARAVAEDLLVLDPDLPVSVAAAPDRSVETVLEDLTSRELEVLQLLAEGLANKEIAQRLGISDHTVKFHVNAILSKLDAHSRTEAVTRAARLGLLVL